MNTLIFWIGVVVLVVGVTLFYYGYSTIQNIKFRVWTSQYSLDIYFLIYPSVRLQWDLANILQPIGLGVSVLGIIVLAYGVLRKT